MPKLDDPIHEEFAQRVAAGSESLRKAYVEARVACGNNTPINSVSASVNIARIMRDPAIRKRIEELLNKKTAPLPPAEAAKLKDIIQHNPRLIQHFVMTRQWVIDELVDNVKLAKAKDTLNLAAANKALELLGRECGMFATIVKQTVTHVDPDQLSDGQLADIISRADAIATPRDPSKLN